MRLTRKLRMRTLLLGLLLVGLQASRVAGETYKVDTYEIEVNLVPDKTTIILGEPTYLSFIVHNHSAQDLTMIVGGDYRNALGRPESFKVTVTKADGRSVPQPSGGFSMGGLVVPRTIPAKGSFTFKLFLPHWAIFEDAGSYSIVARRMLQISQFTPDDGYFGKKTTDLQVQASTKIEIVPTDKEQMGKVITALGDAMLGRDYDKAEGAARTLSYIQDERVIPYFVKALGTNDYSQKFTALQALAKFNNEAAFEALKKGMATRGDDIGNTTTAEGASQLADNIRHAAASALAKSPHPGAIPFLLSHRKDASEGVRVTILHVLGKMKPNEAIPILKEMTNDKSKIVSDEAKRYIQLLSAKG